MIEYKKDYSNYVSLKRRKIINIHPDVNLNEHTELVFVLLNGYPLKSIYGKQTRDGDIFINSLVISVIKALLESQEIDNTQKAHLESIEFEFLITKPSQTEQPNLFLKY